MRVVRGLLSELAGLFVGDAVTAVALVVWIAAAALLLPHLRGMAGGITLFFGNSAILLWSVGAAAKRKPR
ncbi:MAG: hypothetical protein JO060_09460 [Candidatus Eremiobacteraeota bacterium]|nr:hypothetical protein [Candidatus Eremiobacteraeota bacterium]MBV9648448.1 hypothetical protein [Candidatus Eremiobacteraeota bacterium]